MQEYVEGDMEEAPEGSDGSHEVSHSQMFDRVPSESKIAATSEETAP